jgi:hypothetical protein
LNCIKITLQARARSNIGLTLAILFLLATFNIQAQYHVAWTRSYNENYNLLFYPGQTVDGFLFSSFDNEGIKIVKLNTKGKLIFSKEANT